MVTFAAAAAARRSHQAAAPVGASGPRGPRGAAAPTHHVEQVEGAQRVLGAHVSVPAADHRALPTADTFRPTRLRRASTVTPAGDWSPTTHKKKQKHTRERTFPERIRLEADSPEHT